MDLSAPIIPGKAAAGIELAGNIRDVLAIHQADSIRQLRTHDSFTFGPVRIHAAKETGDLLEICVSEGYTGKTPQGIGIGISLGQVEEEIGRVSEHEDGALQVEGIAGLLLETSALDSDPRSITHLFVVPVE